MEQGKQPLKFGQHRMSNNWHIAHMEFLVMVCEWVVCKEFSCQVEFGLWQQLCRSSHSGNPWYLLPKLTAMSHTFVIQWPHIPYITTIQTACMHNNFKNVVDIDWTFVTWNFLYPIVNIKSKVPAYFLTASYFLLLGLRLYCFSTFQVCGFDVAIAKLS